MCLQFHWQRTLLTGSGFKMSPRGGGEILAASDWPFAGVFCRPHLAVSDECWRAVFSPSRSVLYPCDIDSTSGAYPLCLKGERGSCVVYGGNRDVCIFECGS